MIHDAKKVGVMCAFVFVLLLTGCISKGIEMTEQQQRMARCDQYIEMARDDCLRGENVTIDDYNDEYRVFEKNVREQKERAEKVASENEKLKAEKLKEALSKSKEAAEISRQAEIEKELKLLEDGTN